MLRAACAVYFIALGLWVGGLSAIGFVVAPTAFKGAESPEQRARAGSVVGESLRRFAKVEAVCAVLAIVSGVVLQSVGAWGPVFRWPRMTALAGMSVLLVVYSAYVYPELERLRGDPSPTARERSRRLHDASTRLVGTNLLAGVALLGLSAAALRSPDGS